MLAKRIIPCLDVDAGRVVKGVKFVEIRDAGDPVEVARRYNEEGADEITFLDITASSDERDTIVHVVEQVASEVFIPLTVGGGIRTIEDVRRMLNAGADKVGDQHRGGVQSGIRASRPPIASAPSASWWPSTPSRSAGEGEPLKWEIFTHGGRKPTGLDAVAWARKMADYGAGEILLTSMDRDGTKIGFDNRPHPRHRRGGADSGDRLRRGRRVCSIWWTASNWAGADAVLAASIFHFAEYSIGEAKRFMQDQGVEVRL